MHTGKEIRFGRFRLDLANECLWLGARALFLRPKAFAVLKLLVEHPAQLVTKRQLMDAVWPDTFVGDAVLKDNIRQLRNVLDDDADSPTYIETAHRRGYRFIGRISEQPFNKLREISNDAPVSALMPRAAALASFSNVTGVLGRDSELAKLQSWLEQALAGKRQTIFVTGEPGIGKTTVVQTFLEQASQVPGLRVVRGQCLERFGAGEAYLPVLDGFSRLCRSRDGAQVLSILRQHAPAWLGQMASFVPQSERQNVQTAVATTRERMLREMTEAIETLTAESPLVLVLEDLHWSDYSTLDLISHLARRQDPARLMVIGTYRPVDVIVSDHPIKRVKRELQAHGLCHELRLEYLDEDTVTQYVEAKFPRHQFPSRLQKTIYWRTEGNPLFMVNLLEYLVDEKIVVEEHGASKLRVDLSEVERGVPANLRQLIEQQIERLSSDERTVLEAASVAGMECCSVAIAAGLDAPIQWVEEQCEELARRHQFLSPAWLVELPDGTITPRHRFIHILYRDVLYQLIPAMRRSQIHQRIAERGIAVYGERVCEIAAELAMHFEQSRDWPSALKYLVQAGEKATNSSAHHEAADLAKRGLEVLKFLPDTAERAQQEIKLRMILGVSLIAIKGFASAEVEEVYVRRRELFWLQGPSPELFHMLWSLNLYYQFSGELQSSLEITRQLLQMAEGLKEGSLIMEAHRAMGALLVILGQNVEALKHLEEGSKLSDTHNRHRYSAFIGLDCKVICGCFAARALWVLGYPDLAAERTTWALQLAREGGHPQTLVVAGHFAAQLHQLRGEVSLVYECAKEAVELADENGLELWLAFGVIELGWAEAELGNTQQGIEKMQRALAAYKATGAKLWSSYSLQLLADQLAKAGRVEEAFATITEALEYAEQSGEGYSLAELYRIKGELILKTDDRILVKTAPVNKSRRAPTQQVEARACFEKALSIAKQQQARSWELRAAMSLSRLESERQRPAFGQVTRVLALNSQARA